MRILIVGAGGLGGYIGGRLLAGNREVTFLTRPGRAQQLRETGLVITSGAGNIAVPNPPTITSDQLKAAFDLVILSCKAFDLDGAIEAFAPAVGPQTLILPVLNGLRHLEVLERRFGAQAVLAGYCFISAGRNAQGHIQHFGELKSLTFGGRDGVSTPRIQTIAKALSVPGIDVTSSTNIMQEMWEKWVLIATGAGGTCLLRSSVGDIVAAGASGLLLALLEECNMIAERQGHPLRPAALERGRAMFSAPGSAFTASMFRDIEGGARLEADHIVGDLLTRGVGIATPMLTIAMAHLNTYEARRQRELAQASAALEQRT